MLFSDRPGLDIRALDLLYTPTKEYTKINYFTIFIAFPLIRIYPINTENQLDLFSNFKEYNLKN